MAWVGARRAAVTAAGRPDKKPLVVGLTGSIGMGKSAVTAQLKRLGFPVHDADQAVHEMYAPGGSAVVPLEAEFGAVLDDSGAVSRDALSALLRKEPSRLDDLNRIVHPLVADHRDRFLAAHSDKFLCVLDVPLLFETKGEKDCDVVVVVSTKSEAIQRSRVLARPRMTPDKLAMILGKQVPDAEKRERADFVIDTSSPCLTAMRCQVAELVESLAEAFPGPFRDKVLERGDRSSTALVAMAFDLDDTIWDCKKWCNDIEPLADAAIKQHLPEAHRNGIRYADPETKAALAALRSQSPLLEHDFSEMRRQLFATLAAKHGDPVEAATALTAKYLEHRSQVAFDNLYPFAVPFLQAAKQKGLLLASVTDGNGDVTRSEVLDELFDVNVSSMSGGKPKPHLAQFLEILAKLRSINGSDNVRASQVMVIGDNLMKDIGGARQAGMKSMWIRVNGDFDDDSGTSAGALRVTTLDATTLNSVTSSL